MSVTRRASIALIAATLLLAACGGDPSTSTTDSSPAGSSPAADAPATGGTLSAQEYASTVCTALGTWLGDVQAMGQNMPTTYKSAKQGKKAVNKLFSDVVASTDTLVTTLEATSPPDVSGGEEAHNAIVTSMTTVQASLAETQEEIAGLPTNNDAAFAASLQAAIAPLATVSTEATAGLTSITDQDLNQAFLTDPACTSMGSAASAPMPTT